MKKILSILLVLAVLIACAPVQPEPTATETTKLTEVKFGWVGPLTGDLSTLGTPIKDAVALAEEEINVNNVIPGKKITILYEDDACDPVKSTNAVHKLIDTDKVTALIGPACSGTVLAAAPIVEESKVLLFSYSATNPTIKDSGEYIFRNVPSDSGQGVAGADIVQKLGAKKAAVIYRQTDWGVGLKDVFSTQAAKNGIEIVAVEAYNSDEKDFKVQISKVKEAKPDAIYMLAFPAEAVVLLKQIREAGLTVQIIAADGSKDNTIISGAGTAAEGMIVTLPAVEKSAELDKFAAAFKAKTGKENSAYTPEAYDAVYILAKACANTDCTSTAMKDFLYSMGEYKGASGTYSFDKDGEVQKSYDFFQVKDDKFVPYTAS